MDFGQYFPELVGFLLIIQSNLFQKLINKKEIKKKLINKKERPYNK